MGVAVTGWGVVAEAAATLQVGLTSRKSLCLSTVAQLESRGEQYTSLIYAAAHSTLGDINDFLIANTKREAKPAVSDEKVLVLERCTVQ